MHVRARGVGGFPHLVPRRPRAPRRRRANARRYHVADRDCRDDRTDGHDRPRFRRALDAEAGLGKVLPDRHAPRLHAPLDARDVVAVLRLDLRVFELLRFVLLLRFVQLLLERPDDRFLEVACRVVHDVSPASARSCRTVAENTISGTRERIQKTTPPAAARCSTAAPISATVQLTSRSTTASTIAATIAFQAVK